MAPFFEISPQSALIDEHLAINLFNLPREQPTLVHAQVVDGAWTIWEAQAVYQPGNNGRVSLNSDAPLSGTYQGIDATGLFWSMKAEDRSTRFTIQNQAPLTYTLQAQVKGESMARVQVQRQVLSKDVMRLDVRERGLVGTFFIPASTAPHPAVMVLGGSENGARGNEAALLASRGYVTLALAYCGAAGLPVNLERIALEYFETALDWLSMHPAVDAEQIAVVGHGRGAELGLLLAATFPQIHALVAASPSSVLFAGGEKGSEFFPAWTYRNQVLPFTRVEPRGTAPLRLIQERLAQRPYQLRSEVMPILQDSKKLAHALIPVEQIKAPVLLISGKDDQFWPSDLFAEMIIDRMSAQGNMQPVQHLCYPDAGHYCCFPGGLPGIPPMNHYGGSKQANALALADSWTRILAFLDTHFSRSGDQSPPTGKKSTSKLLNRLRK